ncbi:RXT2-like protein [Coniella lustricola]|uniref:RXT2-like protein n=1 Tax=Coniella lustricola TaxID=2025994 RepID=A0A2T2ZTY1_9PEZI|nr:RXT2-like protein [Coniella lustricola]
MTSREQVYVLETIRAMKKKIARDTIESDSDSEIQAPTNRGNKMKQKAKFVREGKLGPPTGPAVYKEVVEHTGYRRAIISRNPPLVDEDGYDIDSDDDEERIQEAVAAAAETDPYSSIRLEQLLAPLTAVTDLPAHPTLSRPFVSPALTELANQGSDLMHKENAALSKVRPLLTKLSGDHTWANCEMFLGPNDREFFDDAYVSRLLKRRKIDSCTSNEEETAATRLGNQDTASRQANGAPDLADAAQPSPQPEQSSNQDVAMTDNNITAHQEEEGNNKNMKFDVLQTVRATASENDSTVIRQNRTLVADHNEPPKGDSSPSKGTSKPTGEGEGKGKEQAAGSDTQDGNIAMVLGGIQPNAETRQDEQQKLQPMDEGNDSLADLADDSFIHPIFLAPRAAHPDRDVGLPEQEAEDVRRLLQLYVQKQEEVCRGARKLYEGLLKADRMRKTVLAWSKAEAHCGPNRDMSDGEDWYDKEEWGLTEDLKKGVDEEEEDTTQPQKKTRNRNK